MKRTWQMVVSASRDIFELRSLEKRNKVGERLARATVPGKGGVLQCPGVQLTAAAISPTSRNTQTKTAPCDPLHQLHQRQGIHSEVLLLVRYASSAVVTSS